MRPKSYTIRIPRSWVRVALTVVVTSVIVAPLTALATHSFTDVPNSNTFHSDIAWLKESGVTKGCNPPANTQYCPDDNVTRGQMAAFMHRFAGFLDAENGTPAQADNATTVGGLAASQLVHSQQMLFAGVTIVGDLAAGNALSATKDGTGSYLVTFDRSLVGCAGSATGGWSTDDFNSVGLGTTFTLYLGTFFAAENQARVTAYSPHQQSVVDGGFTLTIMCPSDELTLNSSSSTRVEGNTVIIEPDH